METKYDGAAGGHDREDRKQHPLWKKVDDRWLREYRWSPGLRVLDLGCGVGKSTELIAERGVNFVLGIDSSQRLVQLARQRTEHLENVNYLITDLMHSRLRHNLRNYCGAEPFKIAISIMSLHYASTRQELMTYIRNTSQCLTERGSLLAILLDPDSPIYDFHPGCPASTRWLDEEFVEGSRIETTIYDGNSRAVNLFTNFYWNRQTYHEVLQKYGFQYIKWVKDDVLVDMPFVMLLAAKSPSAA